MFFAAGLNRLLVWVQDLVAPGHVDQVPYLIAMAGGSANPLESWIVFLTIGTIIGGFVSGLWGRRVKLETNKGPNIDNKTRWVMAFIGGGLMGYGARLARGRVRPPREDGPASVHRPRRGERLRPRRAGAFRRTCPAAVRPATG